MQAPIKWENYSLNARVSSHSSFPPLFLLFLLLLSSSSSHFLCPASPPRFSSLITLVNSLLIYLGSRCSYGSHSRQRAQETQGSGALSRAVVGDPWTLYPRGTVKLFQKMVMILATEMHMWWCFWRLKHRCQLVPNSWVQFVSGASLEGSLFFQPLEGRHESPTLFSALS